MAALDGAVALAEVDAVAVAVDRDLDLDVAVVLEPLLEVQRVVTERGARLRAADLDRRLELAGGADHAHALAAAAGRRLDEDREADPGRLVEGVGVVAQEPVRARDRRQAEARQQAPGPFLGGEPLEDVWGDGPMNVSPWARTTSANALVLGQEAVARVDRVAAGDERGADDRGRRGGSCAWRRPDRCRSPRRRAGPAGSRDRPRCRRRPRRCRAAGTPGGPGARSRRGWR